MACGDSWSQRDDRGFEVTMGQSERVQRLSRLRQWAVAAACAPLCRCSPAARSRQQGARTVHPKATAPAIAGAGPGTALRRRRRDAIRRARWQSATRAAAHHSVPRAPIAAASTTIALAVSKLRGPTSTAAVDLMLTSGMDLKSDPQLSDEFDHLLNADQLAGDVGAEAGQRVSRRQSKPLRSMPPNEVTFPPRTPR